MNQPPTATIPAPAPTPAAPPAAGPPSIGPEPADAFAPRHLGSQSHDLTAMLEVLGCGSLEELIEQTVPADLRLPQPLELSQLGAGALTEHEALAKLREMAEKNQVFKSMIGMGYHGTKTPPAIRRNILENPHWYTPYTPYQAEISQGRLEALLNFQTMVSDLTALPLTNASLLDEATAAAEAMAMCYAIGRRKRDVFYVAEDCHPQTIAVVRTRAESLGLEVNVAGMDELTSLGSDGSDACGVLVQYPASDGLLQNLAPLCEAAHQAGALVVTACDLLALTKVAPPGEWGGGGADIAVGATQRFGVPMGYGGPHAAYLATREKYARKMPGRLVGVSRDIHGDTACRLAIQTREQHIRREKATSNICTAQVLPAILAGAYAVYHGPDGLRRIAQRVHDLTGMLARGLAAAGHHLRHQTFFDTLAVRPAGRSAEQVLARAAERGINLRRLDETTLGITLDETTQIDDVREVLEAFDAQLPPSTGQASSLKGLERTSDFLTHPVFHRHHSEHELLRYLSRLQRKDISLAESMIPLGSCTMKLNAAAEMLPITWPQFAQLHPYAPAEQARGYVQLFEQLEQWLAQLTGFAAVSLQPNAGSQGEYAGLLAIRAYHRSHTDPQSPQRDVCLIPTSAHGTNPASAVIAGLRVVAVECDERGNIDVDDLRRKAAEHADDLAALMITYPSTHGVFEPTVKQVCRIVHEQGGLVYLDGANMNAMVGICRPADLGADVCHLNLHKTFCIPHGGGGPGMGPIAVAEHLKPFVPGSPVGETTAKRPPDLHESFAPAADEGVVNRGPAPSVTDLPHRDAAVGPVAAAAHGSPSILPISWMYLAMMGAPGLTRASQVAVLNANYMADRLRGPYEVLYAGEHGRVAHEFILDCRAFEKTAEVSVEDIAKRLMDFGFHAPTMSWPVPGTLMIEPTESESKEELDRFCEALLTIREEIAAIERGELDREDNPLKHAPHTAAAATADHWPHGYPRQQAVYPRPWVRQRKYWPAVGRVEQAYGDRNLMCTCPSVTELSEAPPEG